MNKVLLLVSLIASVPILADDMSAGERMMMSMGVDQVLLAQKKAYEADAKKQVDIVMTQLESTLSQVSKETSLEIASIMENLMTDLNNSWDIETAIKVYSAKWDENYTQSEIESVIEKYEDPSAKKELETVLGASAALNEYISSSYNTALEESMGSAMLKIQLVFMLDQASTESSE